jgi:hypothetical protein
MNRDRMISKRCRRCNQPAGNDMICQDCKSELLSNYEASSDWQTAFEIEKAAETALRYRIDENDEGELYY